MFEPKLACVGTLKLMTVEEQGAVAVALPVPNALVLSAQFAEKFVPVILTAVFLGPIVGVSELIVGIGTAGPVTVNVEVADACCA